MGEGEARRHMAAGKLPPSVGGGPRIPSGKLARRIIAVLRSDPRRAWTPEELRVELRLKKPALSAIRKELCRLLKPGQDDTPPPLQRVERGLYACHLGPGELAAIESPEAKVHALQLVWKAPGLPPNGGSPPRSHAGARARDAGFGVIRSESSWIHDEESRSWRCTRYHDGMKLTLQAYPTTGTLMVSVDSSRTPLSHGDLAHLRTFLQATLQGEGFPWTEPRVVTVEINRDFQRVRLGGREAARFFLGRMGLSGDRQLKLNHLEGALVQIYNKRELGVMRQEIRLQPRDLDLSGLQSLVSTMFYGPPSPSVPDVVPDGEPGGYA